VNVGLGKDPDIQFAMFRDKFEAQAFAPASAHSQGHNGKKVRLVSNSFRLQMIKGGAMCVYGYVLDPPAKSLEEEQWVIQSLWSQLEKHFSTFVIKCPGRILSPTATPDFKLKSKAGQYDSHSVVITLKDKHTAEQFNAGSGAAQIVAQHVMKSLVGSVMYHKVGRRWYTQSEDDDPKAQSVFSGFHAAFALRNGFQMHIDPTFRIVHQKSVLDTLAPDRSGPLDFKDPEVESEWIQRCMYATVVTKHNNRIYRIKQVHFDMTPLSSFSCFDRDSKSYSTITFQHYYDAYYTHSLSELGQPMLEAVPDKDTEKVFLVPELCEFTGFCEAIREDKVLMTEALKQCKVSPPDRLAGLCSLATQMMQNSTMQGGHSSLVCPGGTAQDWSMSLDRFPQEVEARTFDSVEVCFGPKRYRIEEGNFQRWMRNGLQCPAKLEDWIFIYPESDASVLDIWLRSLRDIAQVAFNMKMSDPQRIACSNQLEDMTLLLQQKLTPTTQLVLLLAPRKDSRRVYRLFKQATVSHESKHPCVTQVVRSETLRKRHAIAAVLSRIVLQINAKFCGPLWHVDLESPLTHPLFTLPTMVIGMDEYRSPGGDRYLGFVASLDTNSTEYYSNAWPLTGDPRRSASEKIQEGLKEAILRFVERNDGIAPEHFVVYRASVQPEEWAAVQATEIEAMELVLHELRSRKASGSHHLTFIAITRRTSMRFFVVGQDKSTAKNPDPGTVIDSPAVNRSDILNFYLINHAVGKGCAIPTQYSVLHDSAHLPADVLQNLTYRLSFLYFNHTGSVRMPAPAQYAKKIAHFIGSVVQAEPHHRLLRTFFYL